MEQRLRYGDLLAANIIKNRATLNNWIKLHGFPPGQLTGPNCRTWGEAEVQAWLAGRPAERKKVPAIRHRYSDRGDDVYETPAVAVEALLGVEQLPHRIWECCCGPGAIVSVLRQHGHDVVATDLVDHGCPDSQARVDFLMETKAPDGVGGIVTNVPFKLATEFVEHAFDIGVPYFATLQRLAFLESERRSHILDGGHLARVHAFKNRLPMMHRHGWDGPKASSSIPFAWFVFDRDHSGPTTIDRIGTRLICEEA